MKVILGSVSQRKIEVTKKVFDQVLRVDCQVEGFAAQSGVPNTPFDRQTFEGAKNRAIRSRVIGEAEYFVGLESGLVDRYGKLFEEVWAIIMTKDGREFVGYSSGLKVPDQIVKKMKESGKEHSEVMAAVEHELKLPNSDTWSNYSGGAILRDISLEEALRNALIQSLPNDKSLYHL